jgi:hypothetical protein
MPTYLRSLAFASLVWLFALQAMADVSGAADLSQGSDALQQAAMVYLPDEFPDPVWTVTQIALTVLMMVMIAVGLTITFTLLRKDIKHRRRSVYRPRGPPPAGA